MADPVTHHPAAAGAGETRAAGAVLWQRAAAGIELALVHRPRYDDWTFPKGKALPGEHMLLTAVREVAEETGVPVVLGRRLSTSRYPSDQRVKRVDWWAASPAPQPAGQGEAAGPPAAAGFVPNDEVDDLRWLPPAAAHRTLTYPRDVALLAEFAAGPAATAPLILVRHTDARGKDAWRAAGHPDDLTRPLTSRGQAQSRELAEILACFGAVRVVSSAAERCLATMRPYAAATGAPLDSDPVLTAGPDGTDTDGARQQMIKLAGAGDPVVICAHRENLPVMLAAACDWLGAPVPAGPPLPKGGFWILHVAAGTLIAAEQHDLSE